MKDNCSSVDELGNNLNYCKDLPVTFCPKCERLYYVDEEGTRTEIFYKKSNGL